MRNADVNACFNIGKRGIETIKLSNERRTAQKWIRTAGVFGYPQVHVLHEMLRSDKCVLDKIMAYKEGLKLKVETSAKDLK